MPRRSSTTRPSWVTGIVVTTSRGLTYAMNPQSPHASRSRCSPSTKPNSSRAPHREQKLIPAAIHGGTPAPDSISVDRASGPRSRADSGSGGGQSGPASLVTR
jgi:hypothetical protein